MIMPDTVANIESCSFFIIDNIKGMFFIRSSIILAKRRKIEILFLDFFDTILTVVELFIQLYR